MENKQKELQNEISEKRIALDSAIANNESKEEIYKVCGELDKAIAEYLNYSKTNDEEDKRLLGKYRNIIEQEYKNEIIELIKNDVKKNFTNILDEELNHFCNNVYIFSVLRANNVKEEEILKQIMYRNNLFQYEMAQKGKEIKPNNPKVAEDYYIKLINKYEKIIEERM